MSNNYELTNYIINRIKELRIQKNLTQEELSLSSGLDTKYINKLENGRFSVRIETLSKILDTLNIDYFDFFEFSKTQNSKIMNELVSRLATFPEEEQENKIKAILQLLK
ncbi:helix-turn-helix domain-containing protein [Streptococcus salivarius]|jgi:DNA-binding helix-turn-helix protein|uniref:helix-turn-helix domain-containing protein n=1 Tax=Streptococcus salivarius TaxID=1304 RepID=UPI001C02E1C8|nr:helix-turn-helix transcriptional regulator [Streptococcus salivarius]MBT9616385.1 helix-turn-helix domain-containing protein [Streptococcus salivarius]